MPNVVCNIALENIVNRHRFPFISTRDFTLSEYQYIFRHYVWIIVACLRMLNEHPGTFNTTGNLIPYNILMKLKITILQYS